MTREKPIEVCLVSKHFYPALSGAGDRFRRYAPGLCARGIHLYVSTVQVDGTAAHEIINGIPVYREPLTVEPRAISAALLKRTVQHCRETNHWPDVLHLLNHSLSGTPDIWRAKLRGIPCVFSQTMVLPRQPLPYQRLRNRIVQWLMLRPFTCVIANSGIIAQTLIGHGISARQVKYIPNGVEVQRFRPPASPKEKETVRRQLGFGTDDELVLFVGFLSRRKGVDLLIHAWPQVLRGHPNARLLLVGPQYEGFNQSFALTSDARVFLEDVGKNLKHLPMPDRVVLTGQVSNVEDYLRAADVFVFPSRREGMPNAVLEAMSTALPCVLTPFDGLPAEMGSPGREFLLVPREPNALAEGVLEILRDKERGKALGQAARQWVRSHQDIEKSLDQYARIYQTLTTKRTGMST